MRHDYELVEQNKSGLRFTNEENGVKALLAERALYFSTNGNQVDIFEINLAESEFTDIDGL